MTLTDADWFNDVNDLYYTIFGDPATAAAARTTFLTYSSTYTPTLYNTTNVAASTAYLCQYMRVGSMVTVCGQVDIDVTAGTTVTLLGMSLPIASNFANAFECAGQAGSIGNGTRYGISGDITDNRASFAENTSILSTANTQIFFIFAYLIV